MASYYQRYKAGEFRQVWHELREQGAAVFEAPLHGDAWAVAQLTMERLHDVLTVLHQRLLDIGYAFDHEVFTPPDPATIASFEERVARLPLSLKAFYAIIGGVSFVGQYPGLTTFPDDSWSPVRSAVLSDPLLIVPLYDDYLTTEGTIAVDISGDIFGKANISGGQCPTVELPDATIDPLVIVTLYEGPFVDYLRVHAEWGGFPGFSWLTTDEKRAKFEAMFGYTVPPIPQSTIDYLTKGLEDF